MVGLEMGEEHKATSWLKKENFCIKSSFNFRVKSNKINTYSAVNLTAVLVSIAKGVGVWFGAFED